MYYNVREVYIIICHQTGIICTKGKQKKLTLSRMHGTPRVQHTDRATTTKIEHY